MKKLLFSIIFLSICSNGLAQVFSISNNEKKFISTFEAGWDFSTLDEVSTTINVDYTLGKNFGKYWVLGVGTGLKATTISEEYQKIWDKNIGAIPLFFDAKCYLLNTKIHPLLRFRAGYNIVFQKPEPSDVSGGFQIDASAGLSLAKTIYVLFNYREADYNFDNSINRTFGFSIGLSL